MYFTIFYTDENRNRGTSVDVILEGKRLEDNKNMTSYTEDNG